MSESHTTPTPPEPAEVIEAIRAALVKLLPPEDLAQVDLDGIDSETQLLGLPIDSAVLMALMAELEDGFSVFIEEEAAFSFTVVGDISDYMRSRIALRAQRLSDE